eukprot:scaffold20193_cov59-Phaeocystis_antarctica.AAC.3
MSAAFRGGSHRNEARRCADVCHRSLIGALHSAAARHRPASLEDSAFHAGASHSAADRRKSAAASLSSAAERGPTSQAPYDNPPSTNARMTLATTSFGAALTTLADSALSPSSFHHSGLATSAHSIILSSLKPFAVATAQPSEPTSRRSLESRNRWTASTLCPEMESTKPRL